MIHVIINGTFKLERFTYASNGEYLSRVHAAPGDLIIFQSAGAREYAGNINIDIIDELLGIREDLIAANVPNIIIAIDRFNSTSHSRLNNCKHRALISLHGSGALRWIPV